MDEVRLGPSTGLDSGTAGTFYLDGFESRRSTYTLAPAAQRSGVGPLAGLLPGGRSHPSAGSEPALSLSKGQALAARPEESGRTPGFFARLSQTMYRALAAAFLPGLAPAYAGVQPAAAVLSAPPAGQAWKTYYYAGGLVAMREITAGGSVLSYLHQDHLGSTSLATNSSGAEVPNTRQSYFPFGDVRVEGSGLPTDRTFTGQYADASTGLYFYNARYYSSAVGRFVSADTIVPSFNNSQSLNRYGYSLSNPLKYTDPTGHDVDCGIGESECRQRVRIEKLLSDIFDPVFGGEDFLRSLPPIPASYELNWYDLFGEAASAVGAYSELFNVPPEFVAATLNYENHRGSGPGGAFNRGVKRTINPVLQLIDPGHDGGLGYSFGVGNVKPAAADTSENYFLTHYDPSSPEYQVMSALDQLSGPDKLILDKVNVLYVAANVRIAIDEIYYQGYTGAISKQGAALIISYHNSPRSLIAGPAQPGIEGVALLIQASGGDVPLLFFPGR